MDDAPRRAASRALIKAIFAVALLSAPALLVLAVVSPSAPPTKVFNSPISVALAAIEFSLVGVAILFAQPRNVVGWIFLAVATGFGVGGVSHGYASYAQFEQHGSLPGWEQAAWLSSWLSISAAATLFTFLFLVFPNGRLPSVRWRPVAWYTAFVIVGVAVASTLVPGGLAGSQPTLTVLLVFLLPAVLLCVAALVVRFRRSRGVERQQIKWLAYAGAVQPLAILGSSGVVTDTLPLQLLSMALPSAIPIATGIAILRHHLYDIDRLIKRTVVYALTSAGIATAFYLGLVGLQPLLGAVTAGQEVAVAISTLVSFALFQPIRRRVQAAVDRRFDRARYDAALTLDVFGDRVRDEVDMDALRGELLGAVRHTMAPAHVSLWLRARER